MRFHDLLLHIDTYPKPTPAPAIEEAVRLAASLGGKLTALALEIEIPLHSNRLADYLIGLSDMATAEEARSRKAGKDGLAYFTEVAIKVGVYQAAASARAHHYDVAEDVAKIARTYDLCLLPRIDGSNGQLEVAQSVVFGSGRPVLTFKAGEAAALIQGPDEVVIAWDGSRSAARALADALPLLVRAKSVRILTVLNEKPGVRATIGADAQRHLQAHGVNATLDEVDTDGGTIGAAFDRYLERIQPDLLVMGAYGHSRAREFLLGGATQHILACVPYPTLLSH
ncbi:universal stress protein [Caulobacter vibrioides]|uniref:Universal stress protein n=1 Tax=Caulobacter vibrioides TaxID=155892 RepID=A0A290MX12_CAUVI|nr:universal stress protein [Caulobacter vibrioides]ATC32152.1 universal stress protein [Caulobacter vibrioides]